MSNSKPSTSNRNRRTIVGLAIFYVFFVISLCLWLGKFLWAGIPFIDHLINIPWRHLNNFSLTAMIFLSSAAYPLARRQYRIVVGLGVVWLLINIFTEYELTFLNVRDPVDALAGFLGIIFAGLGLWPMDKYGQ